MNHALGYLSLTDMVWKWDNIYVKLQRYSLLYLHFSVQRFRSYGSFVLQIARG